MTPASDSAWPTPDRLRLDAGQLNSLLQRLFVGSRMIVSRAEPGFVEMTLPADISQLRPGGVVSGPTLMSLADVAAYALVLGHIGEQPMAVTSSLSMQFLAACAPGELHAEARLLKLGRRLATSDVRLWSTPGTLAAQAVVVYALPM